MVLLYTLKCRSPLPLLSAQHYKPPVDFLKGGLTQCLNASRIIIFTVTGLLKRNSCILGYTVMLFVYHSYLVQHLHNNVPICLVTFENRNPGVIGVSMMNC